MFHSAFRDSSSRHLVLRERAARLNCNQVHSKKFSSGGGIASFYLYFCVSMDEGSSRNQLNSPLLAVEQESVEQNEIQTTEEMAESSANDDDAWYHNPYQIIAMISNFSTSYNVVNISLVLPILQQLSEATSQDKSASASSLLAGMIIGQLVGGALGDTFLGRVGALKLVMALQVVASLGSSCLSIGRGDIYMKLALWRFILGVGAGGVYPLAAVLSAEQGKSSEGNGDHVRRVVLTFSMQGLGFISVPLVAVPLLYIFDNLNVVWRIILGLGSVPGFILVFLQWRSNVRNRHREESAPLPDNANDIDIPENEDPVGHMAAESTRQQDSNNTTGWWDAIRDEPGLSRKLIGTAGTWLLFDVLFYGTVLFQGLVVESAFGSGNDDSAIALLRKTAVNSLMLTSIALPGYAVAGVLIGKKTFCVTQTPRYVMLQGFAAMSILYFTIGTNWSYLQKAPAGLITLYGLTFFFANYGPNTTTFILPSLLYSPECRSTWNGISAASGKLGALIGATLFAPAADAYGDANVMIICSGVAVFALIVTWIFVPKDGDGAGHQPLQQEIISEEDVVADYTAPDFEQA